MNATVTFTPAQLNIDIVPLNIDASTGTPIAREYVGGEPYTGDYVVIPSAMEDLILPTQHKLLRDDITVTKVPYFETSNVSGTTVYIASEV